MMRKCTRCEELKDQESFSLSRSNKEGRSLTCKPCVSARNKEYWRTPKGRMSYIYAGQCVASRARKQQPPQYTREALTEWAFTQGLEALVAEWAQQDYLKDFAPSVDRLDDSKGYSFDNIQLVRWVDNNEKMYKHRREGKRITRQNRQVEQLTLAGDHVAFYPSIALAAREVGCVRTNINRMCTGHPAIKSVGGYLWRYA